MMKKKDVHISGALAAVLDSGGITSVTVDDNPVEKKETSSSSQYSQYLSQSSIIEINPHSIANWRFSDRTDQDLGNIPELADSFKQVGQKQPCIVRPSSETGFEFELIIGERRWRAAKLADIKLKVIVENLSDRDAALCQAIENEKRKDLSDFAKGMNYSKLIENEIVSRKELESILNKSKVEISRLLSFGQIPKEIWDNMKDLTKISSRTASEIRHMINHKQLGDKYLKIILQLADKISEGKVGARNLRKYADRLLTPDKLDIQNAKEITGTGGRHLFTWRRDSNGQMSISFPKDIRKFLNRRALEGVLKSAIENQLNGGED